MGYHVATVMVYDSGRPKDLLIVVPKVVQTMLNIRKGVELDVFVTRGRIVLRAHR